MPKFRKNPVVIEAIQWDGTLSGSTQIEFAFPRMNTTGKTSNSISNAVDYWCIWTLEGQHRVSPGDWIIKGVKGEFYPCKPDIFEATYEPVEAAQGEGE